MLKLTLNIIHTSVSRSTVWPPVPFCEPFLITAKPCVFFTWCVSSDDISCVLLSHLLTRCSDGCNQACTGFYWLKPDIHLSVPLFKMLPDEVSLAHLWLEISFTNKQEWSECTPSWTSYTVLYVHLNTGIKSGQRNFLKSIFLK